MLVVVTLYVSKNKKNEHQWGTVKTAFNRTEIKYNLMTDFDETNG